MVLQPKTLFLLSKDQNNFIHAIFLAFIFDIYKEGCKKNWQTWKCFLILIHNKKRARNSWQQLQFATLLPFARLLYFNVETLPLATITIRNTVTIRQVLRDWHHRPIFLALKSLQFASFFLFLPIPNLANVRDIGVRKF